MTLPAPNLDDRRFQDLVDESKRMLQRKWPEWTGWTDHNVSDPGVTLIETFAYMVDQLLYRMNHVTDLTYVKLLELIGLRLQPPTAAAAPVTFWLTAPQAADVAVPAGTEVATERTETADAIVFRTVEPLEIVTCRLAAAASASSDQPPADKTDALSSADEVLLFAPRPAPGDGFYIGLSVAVPACAVALRFEGDVQGYGINPERPPRRWDAWDGRGWTPCEIDRDETGGFNRAGDVVLHVPRSHRMSTIATRRAGWLRCVVTAPAPDEHTYGASPRISGCQAFTIGGTVDARHGERIVGEIIGTAEGAPGQQLELEHRPVVFDAKPEILEVVVEEVGTGSQPASRVELWERVESFAQSTADDQCFVLDPVSGTVLLPPAVREANGTARFYGAVPAPGAVLRLRSYLTGGGRLGNVAARSLTSIRTSLPFIHAAENRVAARGGVDGETIEEAKLRGPLMLRTRERAVTADDFEHLARQAAPNVARVRCSDVAASEPGAVRVLVVPDVAESPDGPDRPTLDQLTPSASTFQRITDYLDERRVVGVRVVIEMPAYQGVTVVARVRARRDAAAAEVEQLAVGALYGFLHPVRGGPDRTGWPFGRPVHGGDVHSVLQDVDGVDFVEEALLFTYDVDTRERGTTPLARIPLAPNMVVFSFAHDVRVEHAP